MHGNAIDGKYFFAVRSSMLHGKGFIARQRSLLYRVLNMFYRKKSFKLGGLRFEV
jgi:hypothetical protein